MIPVLRIAIIEAENSREKQEIAVRNFLLTDDVFFFLYDIIL